MDKRAACHRLAFMNEKITEKEEGLTHVKSNLKWDHENREWYLEREAELTADLEKYTRERDEFIRQYSDIIYS